MDSEKTMEFGDLMDLENVAVIIPGPSGVEWCNQVGCVCCLQMEMEGWVEILWGVPTSGFGCDTGSVAKLRMKHLLEEYGGIFDRVISVDGYTEAWLGITFTLKPEYLRQHPGLGIQPGQEVQGILTWQNCD